MPTFSDDKSGGVFLAILLHEVQGASLGEDGVLVGPIGRGGDCVCVCERERGRYSHKYIHYESPR